jgi:hypothetical protein
MAVVLKRAFVAAAVIWTAALPWATWVAARGSHTRAPLAYAFAAGVYGIGSWICHQRPDRSFYLWAMQMPVCARCAGIYAAGALIGIGSAGREALRASMAPRAARLGTARSLGSRSVTRDRLIVAAAVAPSLVTLAIEWILGIPTSNVVRATAGVPIGATVAWFVLRREVN